MKNSLLICIVFFAFSVSFSQTRLGLKFSPTLSFNRVTATSDTSAFDNNGIGLHFSSGLTADISLSENYAISTGVLFGTKRVAFKISEPSGQSSEKYTLQYIQIPATIKILTNEVALDTRGYFQAGTLFELNIDEKPKNDGNRFVESFDTFDVSLYIGGGLEKKLGTKTSGYLGIFYQRGLINIIADTVPLDGKLELKNRAVGIDFGFKF